MKATTVESVVRTLKAEGVQHLFGLPGGETLDLMDAARREGLAFHLTKHEAGAVFMADVVAQLTRRPSAVLASVGPGAANMFPGIAHAYLDRAPVLAFTGCFSRTNEAIFTHQALDQRAFYRPVTKWSTEVTPAEAQATIRKAVRVALSGRPGPVHLDMPADFTMQETEFDPHLPPVGAIAQGVAPAAAVAEAARRMAAARRPVIMAGQGCLWDGVSDQVARLAERIGAPVVVTPKAKGTIPESHPLFLGVAGLGMTCDALMTGALAEADLVIAVGYDPVEVVRPWLRVWGMSTPTIHIDRLPNVDEYWQAAVELIGDVAVNLNALLPEVAELPGWTGKDWPALRREAMAEVARAEPGAGLSPAAVIRAVREAAPADTNMAVDVGSHKILATQLWETPAANKFFVSNGLSVMSFGLSAANAAKLVRPKEPSIAIVGDGGFAMAMHEVETGVRLGLGVVYCIMNDQTLALIKLKQEKRSYPTVGTEFNNSDYAAIGRAMGADGETVESLGDLRRAVTEAVRRNRPTVLDIRINPAEYRRQM